MDLNLKHFYKPLPSGTVRVKDGPILPTDLCLSTTGDWIRFDSPLWISPATQAEDAIMVARRIEDLSPVQQLYAAWA